MEIRLPAGIYVGLRSSTRSIQVNRQRLEFLRDHFSGLNAPLLRQIPWVFPKLAEAIKPVGKVKVPAELLEIGLRQVGSDDPVILVNANKFINKIPSTFIGLQYVMGKCFLNPQNTPAKFSAVFLTGAVNKKYVERRGVLAWLDKLKDKPNSLGVYFMLNIFRHSPLDILEMALPLKGIEIVDDLKTQGISIDE
jgi:hypothetical protein